jgi:dihydrofolate reductase
MRKIIVHMQTTLDGRISNQDGLFWEPFPFGDAEMAFVNSAFKDCDTWAMSRRLYEFVVPYWEQVAAGEAPAAAGPVTPARADFAAILSDLTKVVFSRTIGPDDSRRRVVISGDIGRQLLRLKEQPGKDIALSCGPRTLGELSRTPGLIDEYLLVLHPAVITAGPRMFDGVEHDLALSLAHAQVFDAGAIIARYRAENAR